MDMKVWEHEKILKNYSKKQRCSQVSLLLAILLLTCKHCICLNMDFAQDERSRPQ